MMWGTVVLPAALLAANLAAASGPAEGGEGALEQCSLELGRCRSFVRARGGDTGGLLDGVAMGGGPSSSSPVGNAADFVSLVGSSTTGGADSFVSHLDTVAEFMALTRAATDAANASAAESIGKSPAGVLAAEYEKNGQVTIRNVWPRSVTLLALQELEEVWQHYRLPATFHGTAFIRAEKDNERIEGGMEFPPFDRLYSIEERSPALRRLVTSSGADASLFRLLLCLSDRLDAQDWAKSLRQSWVSNLSHST